MLSVYTDLLCIYLGCSMKYMFFFCHPSVWIHDVRHISIPIVHAGQSQSLLLLIIGEKNYTTAFMLNVNSFVGGKVIPLFLTHIVRSINLKLLLDIIQPEGPHACAVSIITSSYGRTIRPLPVVTRRTIMMCVQG